MVFEGRSELVCFDLQTMISRTSICLFRKNINLFKIRQWRPLSCNCTADNKATG